MKMNKASKFLLLSCLVVAAFSAHAKDAPETSPTTSTPTTTPTTELRESDCTFTLSKGTFIVRVPDHFTMDICPAAGRKISTIESLILSGDHRMGWISSHQTMNFTDSNGAHWIVAAKEKPVKINAIVRMDDNTITEIRFFPAHKGQAEVTVERAKR